MRDSNIFDSVWRIPLALGLFIFVMIGIWINPKWDFKSGGGPETIKYWKQVWCRIVGHRVNPEDLYHELYSLSGKWMNCVCCNSNVWNRHKKLRFRY